MIDLKLEQRQPNASMDAAAFPVRISAFWTPEDPEDTAEPAPIFVMHTAVVGGIPGDRFSCVASTRQLEDLPEDEAQEGSPFYRVSSILMIFGSMDHAAEFWDKTQAIVQSLADDLYAVENLAEVETVTIEPNYRYFGL
jgi:hypothetical protein